MISKQVVEWDITMEDGISAIGLIVGDEEPAIEVNAKFKKKVAKKAPKEFNEDFFYHQFLAQEQSKAWSFQVDESVFETLRANNTIIAPAMIPNKLILRVDEETGDPFYGYFSERSVRTAAYSFLKHGLQDQFNINHDENDFVDGVYIGETWLIEDITNDKSRVYGFNLPVGSWMTLLKFDNKELYDKYVASGELNGLSIETQLLERIVFSKIANAGKVGS